MRCWPVEVGGVVSRAMAQPEVEATQELPSARRAFGAHRLLEATRVEAGAARRGVTKTYVRSPQRDDRVILKRRGVVAQRPVARDEQIHAGRRAGPGHPRWRQT